MTKGSTTGEVQAQQKVSSTDCTKEVESDAPESDWEDDDDDSWIPSSAWSMDGAKNQGGVSREAGKQAVLQRLQTRVNFDPMPKSCSNMTHAAKNSIARSEKKASTARSTGLTQDTRATTEQVLDQRTMEVLGKFLKREVFTEIHGCISTGKEANVYYATAPEGVERAVKVYKTSVLIFKDRARYVEGEYRFRTGYCKGNPRKMVAQWAEKEMRNLKRMRAAGIRCPEALELRQNVLVMEFIGDQGDAAPRLKDVDFLEPDEWFDLYRTCVKMMRTILQECRLVHGDLSEYNVLYWDGTLTIIDVSQSVESNHPHALDFLKRDCFNVNNFFGRQMGRNPLSTRRLFDFVVTGNLLAIPELSLPDGRHTEEDILDELLSQAAEGDVDDEDNELFKQTWIPSNLDQVGDNVTMEKELERRAKGEDMLYARLLAEGAAPPAGEAAEAAPSEEEGRCEKPTDAAAKEEASESSAGSGSEEEGEEGQKQDGAHKDGHRPEGMDKHEWKAQVKEERKKKRETKIPKALKQKYHKRAMKSR